MRGNVETGKRRPSSHDQELVASNSILPVGISPDWSIL